MLAELSDGRVIATEVLDRHAAAAAGVQPGAEIISWNGQPVSDALDGVVRLAPIPTPHANRRGQVNFLSRMPPSRRSSCVSAIRMAPSRMSPCAPPPSTTRSSAACPAPAPTRCPCPWTPPSEDSGLGYVRITTFQDDYNLMARVWDRTIQNLIDNEIPGVILDLRFNGGGSLGLALDFAGYFFDEEMELYPELLLQREYRRFQGHRAADVKPGPLHYEGKVAIWSGRTASAPAEGFAYAMQQQDRAVVVGHTPHRRRLWRSRAGAVPAPR